MTDSGKKSIGSSNLKSILRAAGYTLAIYVAINFIAFGWGLLTHDFSNGFSIELKYLAFSIDGELQGLSWKNNLTKGLLLIVFVVFIAEEFRSGRASLSPPDSQ